MPNNKTHKPILVPVDLRDRLKQRRRPHQGIAGVIEELLEMADKIEGKQSSASHTQEKMG
jgi:NTP pyrophosphatase (non-canonical NTP hydrolase)